jgi:hypothetical protein
MTDINKGLMLLPVHVYAENPSINVISDSGNTKRQTKKERAFIQILQSRSGVTENDILRYCHLSSGRNYPNELERILNISLCREQLPNPDGCGTHTRYRIRNRNDAEKVAGYVNTLRKRRNAEPLIEDEIKALLMNY